MINISRLVLITCLIPFVCLAQEAPVEEGEILNRIDFGNAYIRGQTIKSGAVYLMHRKKSEIESMLRERKHYRKEILEEFQVVEDQSVKPK